MGSAAVVTVCGSYGGQAAGEVEEKMEITKEFDLKTALWNGGGGMKPPEFVCMRKMESGWGSAV